MSVASSHLPPILRHTTAYLPEMFCGGWLLVFMVKMSLFIIFYMLVRWTIPRFRFDQLMSLAWKVFIPMALANLVAVMIVNEFAPRHLWILTPAS